MLVVARGGGGGDGAAGDALPQVSRASHLHRKAQSNLYRHPEVKRLSLRRRARPFRRYDLGAQLGKAEHPALERGVQSGIRTMGL